MFNKILIANRGEIACRIIRTCKRLGVHTVAVFSEADKDAAFVNEADEAHALGGFLPQDSYLNGQKIIQVALKTHCEAIHPGYGFLSENAAFANACQQHGLQFIGPCAKAIELMGCKKQAKQLMEKAGLPVIPGFHGEAQTEPQLLTEAKCIGFPVLLKAASGGGGKGMKRVDEEKQFADALASAKREALASFGNDTIIIEKYLAAPRHIEVQIFADNHGNVVHLFERDCSIQRRHQKIIEEAPALHLATSLKEKLYQAAIAAAKAIDYTGAGTLEFLVEDEAFYFMEMNTRLQVEHPVTEMITQVDLVEWQLRVAAGEPLPKTQQAITCHGHAIEVRVYAEDPDKQFLPQTGVLWRCQFPDPTPALRVESGIKQGDEIGTYYDPMLAKIISHGRTRQQAIYHLKHALRASELLGVKTNLAFLVGILGQSPFQAGDITTHYLEQYPYPAHSHLEDAMIAAGLYQLLSKDKTSSPWACSDGWHTNLPPTHTHYYSHQQTAHTVSFEPQDEHHFLIHTPKSMYVQAKLQDEHTLKIITEEGRTYWFILYIKDDLYYVKYNAHVYMFTKTVLEIGSESHQLGKLLSPMPGTVIAVMCKQGTQVKQGEPLMIIEAMKMEHTIQAPQDGTVCAIHFQPGNKVNDSEELLELTPFTNE